MISNYENKIKHPALQNTDTKNNTAMLNAKIIAVFLEGLRWKYRKDVRFPDDKIHSDARAGYFSVHMTCTNW